MRRAVRAGSRKRGAENAAHRDTARLKRDDLGPMATQRGFSLVTGREDAVAMSLSVFVCVARCRAFRFRA
jgi:hypothetical protein